MTSFVPSWFAPFLFQSQIFWIKNSIWEQFSHVSSTLCNFFSRQSKLQRMTTIYLSFFLLWLNDSGTSTSKWFWKSSILMKKCTCLLIIKKKWLNFSWRKNSGENFRIIFHHLLLCMATFFRNFIDNLLQILSRPWS